MRISLLSKRVQMPPGTQQQILPRQPGESRYAYRKRRQLALTGETPYQHRVRLARARGLSLSEARGHKDEANQTAYQKRRASTQRRYGLTPYQYWWYNQYAWLLDNGFTPESTGRSWNWLVRTAPSLRYLNSTTTAPITPDMLAESLAFERTGVLVPGWTDGRIREKVEDVRELVEEGSKDSARLHYFRDRITSPDLAAWWYYH